MATGTHLQTSTTPYNGSAAVDTTASFHTTGSPLQTSAIPYRNLHPQVFTQLLDIQDGNGNTPIAWAVRGAQYDAVQLLLQYGANPILQNNEGLTPLHVTYSLHDLGGANRVLYGFNI